jgi:hypothetical protein
MVNYNTSTLNVNSMSKSLLQKNAVGVPLKSVSVFEKARKTV